MHKDALWWKTVLKLCIREEVKKTEGGGMKSINRLINTEFEKSKFQTLRNKLLEKYITINYYSI